MNRCLTTISMPGHDLVTTISDSMPGFDASARLCGHGDSMPDHDLRGDSMPDLDLRDSMPGHDQIMPDHHDHIRIPMISRDRDRDRGRPPATPPLSSLA
jgi:hypothetical protein